MDSCTHGAELRAVFIKNISELDEKITLVGSVVHHFNNVLKLKVGSEILALDGNGLVCKLILLELNKKSAELKILSHKKLDRSFNLDIFVGQVKKEAMDLVLKQCAELGVRKIIIGQSKFSQRYPLKQERIEKLLISGIEQSNNPYLPKVELGDLESLKTYSQMIYFSSVGSASEESALSLKSEDTLIIYGPEGGYDREEESQLRKIGANFVHLDTPIMRTPTALACGVGFYLAALGQK